ncbi:MAG: glycosyltransferase [Bacteroidales bacterium]|nr:glycosyltransferase [Bacteroidales bacterium]
MKKAIVSVINDLVTDQRVHKSCLALKKSGFEVLLVGRKMRKSPDLQVRPYACKRMKLIFEQGPLFYAEFNLRLFFFLLLKRANLYLSNDLDTLLPNFLISRMKRKPLVFDSHEYFTGTPELADRAFVRKTWKAIEAFIVPRLTEMITVNDSIAGLFYDEYSIKAKVVRNIPQRFHTIEKPDRSELGIPENKKILVLQGSGINIQRGAEELVQAMALLPDFHLMVIGGGDVINQLQKLTASLEISERVRFLPRMQYAEMMAYTLNADLGITLDKDTNINYRFSLPNKLFDYIQAGIPVLASPLPEIKKIILAYDIGSFIVNHKPENIANAIKDAFSNAERFEKWKANTKKASQELSWEKEEKILLNIYGQYN